MSEKKKPAKKATTGTGTTGQKTLKERRYVPRPASPDSPIFKGGYRIGGFVTNRSSKKGGQS